VTLHKVHAEKVEALNGRLRQLKMGNFSYVHQALQLGDLAGNRFGIILRKVDVDDDVLATAMETVGQTGFVNYFGLQRFGTSAVPTHVIGQAILRSDFKEAVQLIIGPKEGDDPELANAKQLYANTGDADGALKMLSPHDYNVEYALLRGLKAITHQNDHLNALGYIPRNLRTMYVHAYQSLVWNTMVSKRLELYDRMKVVEVVS